jgi:RNA-binding protein Musashi
MYLSFSLCQGYPNFVATYGRGYPGFAPSYGYQFPGKCLGLWGVGSGRWAMSGEGSGP